MGQLDEKIGNYAALDTDAANLVDAVNEVMALISSTYNIEATARAVADQAEAISRVAFDTAEAAARLLMDNDLDARLDSIAVAGGNIATLVNGAAAAAQKVVIVDSSTGFLVGSRVAYALAGGPIEYNVINIIGGPTSITLTTNIGSGGIANNAYFSMIGESEYQAALSVNSASSGVNRTLPNALAWAAADTFNVLAYGATGAGVTNDKAAIQAAVDAAEANGSGTVIIPPGVYLLNSEITIDSPNVNIIGMGKPILRASASFNSELLDPESGVIFIKNTNHVTVRDLIIEADLAIASTGLMARDAEHCLISRVKVDGSVTTSTQSGAGIGFYGACHYNRIEYCEVWNAGYSGLNIARDDSPPSAAPLGNVLFANHVENCAQDGIDIYQTKDTKILFNRVINNGRIGINPTGGTTTDPNDDLTIMGNYVSDSTNDGIRLASFCRRARIIGNHCVSNGDVGITAPGFENNEVIIQGNTCWGNQKHGIYCGEKYALVANNQCIENGASSSYHGIAIEDEADVSVVTGNMCVGNAGYGINVSNCDAVSVNSNVCTANITSGIRLNDGKDFQCNSNRCFGNLAHGILTTNLTRPQIHGNYCSENSQATNDNYDNILISNDTVYASVQGNRVHKGVLTNKPKYGINIGHVSVANTWLTNNDTHEGGGTAEVNDVGTSTNKNPGERSSESTWTVVLTGSTGNPTITYTTQAGKYTLRGKKVDFTVNLIIATISGGSGDVRLSLPFAVGTGTSNVTMIPCYVSGPNFTNVPSAIVFNPVGGQSYGNVYGVRNNAAPDILLISGLAAGDTIIASGSYWTA